MVMVSSEYQTCCSVRKAQSEATVNGPIRPVYMINMTISLLAGWSCGVMPVDRPTVPKADGGEQTMTDINPAHVFAVDDIIVVVGKNESIQRFEEHLV